MTNVAPYLWCNKNAEELMNFYVGVFNNAPHKKQDSRIVRIDRFPDKALDEHTIGLEGMVANGKFELDGQVMYAFDGGPAFTFNEAISMCIECADQEEVDYFWGELSAVPEAEACGWLKDKFGVSWQIVPKQLEELMGSKDQAVNERVMKRLLSMKKLDIVALEEAAKAISGN